MQLSRSACRSVVTEKDPAAFRPNDAEVALVKAGAAPGTVTVSEAPPAEGAPSPTGCRRRTGRRPAPFTVVPGRHGDRDVDAGGAGVGHGDRAVGLRGGHLVRRPLAVAQADCSARIWARLASVIWSSGVVVVLYQLSYWDCMSLIRERIV